MKIDWKNSDMTNPDTMRCGGQLRILLRIGLALSCGCVAIFPALAQTSATQPKAPAASTTAPADSAALARELIRKGTRFLLAQQEADGGWASQTGPGVSALCAKALAQNPEVGPQHVAVRQALQFVLRSQRDDGGVYSAEGLLKNYESSVALSALAASGSADHRRQIEQLQNFLIENQWDEGEQRSTSDAWYGGAGYGRSKRPDLSNTQMMVEALHDSGLPKDHPAYRKALLFIQRCQMLGESNDQEFAKGANDGGFIYSPVGGGESKAGESELNGRKRLRSYGTMTYAGFKSLLFAGLSRDDPRVRAALAWFGRYWTLDRNPNMPDAQSREGLYYFYHVFARALDASGLAEITDAVGRTHNWREELTRALAERQQADGSWINEADRWMEGLPALTTAYSLLALQAAYPAQPTTPSATQPATAPARK